MALVVSIAPISKTSAEGDEPTITFSEIMYDVPGADSNREWVEIYNYGDEAVEIVDGNGGGSWRFNDGANHSLRLVQGDLTLEPGGVAVLTSNDENFLAEHDGFEGTVIDTVMSLANDNDALSLSNDGGESFFTEASYTSEQGAGGNGYTLEKIDLTGNNEAENWQESAVVGGTPGEVAGQEEEPEIIEQVISFERGWNLVSSYVVPEEQNIEQVFAPLVDSNVLILVKDGQGRVYYPAADLNQIGEYNPQAGYLVKVSEESTLTISGTERISSSVDVNQGWNLLAYPLEEEHDVRSIVNGLGGGQIEQVKDATGRFFVPAFNFSNMEPLIAGQGYWVKVTEDSVLDWSEME